MPTIDVVPIRTGNAAVDNPAEHRLELHRDGLRAELVYDRTPSTLVLIHTSVPPLLRGGGIGALLIQAAVYGARMEGLRLVARCPFAVAYLQRHPSSVEPEERDRSLDQTIAASFPASDPPSTIPNPLDPS